MALEIVKSGTGEIVAANARRAQGFFTRLRGLLGRTSLEPGEALIFDNCSSVHMIGMKIELDIVFADFKSEVVGIARDAKINSPYYGFSGASVVIEMAAGAAKNLDVGDRLEIRETLV